MKVSELIKELEEFLQINGDLEVVKTGEYVGSESVDCIAFVRGHECLISNKYLDNYTMTTAQKLEKVTEDLKEMLRDRTCNNCRWCNETKVGYTCWETNKELNDLRIGKERQICFIPKDDDYEDRYKLNKIQYCKAKLIKDLKKEEYLEEAEKWK